RPRRLNDTLSHGGVSFPFVDFGFNIIRIHRLPSIYTLFYCTPICIANELVLQKKIKVIDSLAG
ncbi:MAG: hypothetical protein M0Z70_12695, partial [Nitrospiraceae bacterium]|nr:hypothetical protein [Nitrospiraceae bacterium]